MKNFLTKKLDDGIALARISRILLQLKKNQWKSIEELRKIQLKKLKAIINHAYYHVPYYHKLFNSVKFKPNQIRTLEDLQKIPVTTRSDIQNNYSEILSNYVDSKKCNIGHTSGSTGIPLKVISDPETRHHFLALIQYAFFECGLKLRDKLVEVKIKLKNKKTILQKPLNIGFLGRTRISWLNAIEENIRYLKKIKPDALYTYPSILSQLAKEIKEKEIAGINPRLIFTSGEILTPRCKRLAESTFQTRVHNLYGSEEFNRLAFQCGKSSSLHMITDGAVIEVIKDDENVNHGELGALVVTGLGNYAMPLIRYQIGDLGITTDERCGCGRNWPMLKQIEGRTDSRLILPNNNVISPMSLVEAMHPKYLKGVQNYQIIQERKDFFLVKVLINQEFNKRQIETIKNRIKFYCRSEYIDVSVQIVDRIDENKNGKYQPIISKVKM